MFLLKRCGARSDESLLLLVSGRVIDLDVGRRTGLQSSDLHDASDHPQRVLKGGHAHPHASAVKSFLEDHPGVVVVVVTLHAGQQPAREDSSSHSKYIGIATGRHRILIRGILVDSLAVFLCFALET